MNTTPSPEIIEKFPTRFRFTVLSEADVVECVSRVFALIHGVNRDMKSVLTGSPIALGATFTGDDISAANANSKATLLCAVTRLLRAFPRVFYFPSYEIVTHSNCAVVWGQVDRHVRAEFVEQVMDFAPRSFLTSPSANWNNLNRRIDEVFGMLKLLQDESERQAAPRRPRPLIAACSSLDMPGAERPSWPTC